MMMHAADELPLVVVAFWQKTDDGSIEFLVPLAGKYLDALSHRTTSPAAPAARKWVEHQLGFNPRSNARVFPLLTSHIVAFTLTAAEADHLNSFGGWLPVEHVEGNERFALRLVAERL